MQSPEPVGCERRPAEPRDARAHYRTSALSARHMPAGMRHPKEDVMKATAVLACTGLLAATFAPIPASAGCLKSGAVGAVVGHVAGGHGKAGAAVGCAVGAAKKHNAKKQARQGPAAPPGQPGGRWLT